MILARYTVRHKHTNVMGCYNHTDAIGTASAKAQQYIIPVLEVDILNSDSDFMQ